MKHTLCHYRILALLCVFSLANSFVMAQNTTALPTSMYGIGELSAGEGGRYAGMGNIGIALNRVGFQNTLNAAAITRMDTICFTFDVGATASYSRYSLLSDNSTNFTGNPNHFSMGFRVFPRWYALIGVSPYSSVGYLIYTEEEIEGMPNSYLYSSFEGSGGLYRAYITNAFAITPNLSVGANIGMIFGKTTESETQEGAIVTYESSKRAFYADFGVYYDFKKTGRQWAIGAVFAPSIPISHDNTLTYTNTSTSSTLDKTYHRRQNHLPMHIGAGISMTTNRWIATADYNYMDWSKNSSSYTSVKYQNQHKINVGGIYITNPRLPRSTELMAGVGFSNSYIALKSGKMYYMEANIGASFPIRYSFLSLGATWRRQLNSRRNMMQESRWSLNVNLTFGERISRFKLQ